MKILIKIKQSPEQCFLIELSDKVLIVEVRKLLQQNKRSKAIVTALSKGKFIRGISKESLPKTSADIVLTEQNSHFDLI